MSSKPKIAQKAPYILDVKPGKYFWCSCGQSNNQPFCDGTHYGTDFLPQEVNITEEGQVAWCGCKQSCSKPFCDGSHKQL